MRLLDLDNAGFRLLDGDDLVVAGLAGSAPAPKLKASTNEAIKMCFIDAPSDPSGILPNPRSRR